ncbi:MAG: prepilin-type N-terminal cleavage/methylation domain-containing protein [Planctomycetes bacterium]|nr:prepilin-type N-terminal cleavage/methylation domain-containing protein [Planctomycetota bacterium]
MMCGKGTKRKGVATGNDRRAMTLIELLVALALLVVILGLFTKTTHKLIGGIPRAHRDFQANTSVQDMIRRLRRDVESGSRLLRYEGDGRAGGDLLLIASGEGVISYEFDRDQVVRTLAVDDPNVPGESIWSVPHARIDWDVWRQNGAGYALEIRTAIERTVLGRLEIKLHNSHLFFAGIAVGDED